MHYLYDFILRRSHGFVGRLAAGAIIGSIVSVLAIFKDESLAKTASPSVVAICGGTVGILAVLILELLDRDRRKPAAASADPDAPAPPATADRAMGCATVVGIAIGCFSVLCAIVMSLVSLVGWLRAR